MSKKLHDIDFERSMIEKNKHSVLTLVSIPEFNSLDHDIYLHITEDYVTLYKKVPDIYGKTIRIYFVDSVEMDALPMGKIQFDRKMITYFRSEFEEYITFVKPSMDNITDWFRGKMGYEGSHDECAFKNNKKAILVNDDGKRIKTKKIIPANEILGVTLKIKEYYCTGWLK